MASSLGLITQRPSDLAEGVLSQCGTIIAMRLNNDREQACVRAAMPEGSRGFLDAIPALRNRECIVCGEGVSIPIRVAFDDLEREPLPGLVRSDVLAAVAQTGEEEAMVGRKRQALARPRPIRAAPERATPASIIPTTVSAGTVHRNPPRNHPHDEAYRRSRGAEPLMRASITCSFGSRWRGDKDPRQPKPLSPMKTARLRSPSNSQAAL